jgi:hypothetical protein
MRIDEENLLVIENRAAPKWWWLVHTAPTKLTRLSARANLAAFSSGKSGKSREMEKPRWPVGTFGSCTGDRQLSDIAAPPTPQVISASESIMPKRVLQDGRFSVVRRTSEFGCNYRFATLSWPGVQILAAIYRSLDFTSTACPCCRVM